MIYIITQPWPSFCIYLFFLVQNKNTWLGPVRRSYACFFKVYFGFYCFSQPTETSLSLAAFLSSGLVLPLLSICMYMVVSALCCGCMLFFSVGLWGFFIVIILFIWVWFSSWFGEVGGREFGSTLSFFLFLEGWGFDQ